LDISVAPRAHPRRSLARPGCVSALSGPPGHGPGESPALAPRPLPRRVCLLECMVFGQVSIFSS